MPYYYGIGSKKHYFVECAERQDETSTNSFNRYAVNENCVLLLADRVVDKTRLGGNIQPTNKQEGEKHTFVCKGCAE